MTHAARRKPRMLESPPTARATPVMFSPLPPSAFNFKCSLLKWVTAVKNDTMGQFRGAWDSERMRGLPPPRRLHNVALLPRREGGRAVDIRRVARVCATISFKGDRGEQNAFESNLDRRQGFPRRGMHALSSFIPVPISSVVSMRGADFLQSW